MLKKSRSHWLAWGAMVLPASFPCPDLSLGETEEDCPWAPIGKALSAEEQDKASILQILERSSPLLVSQIRKDSLNPVVQSAWGTSINYDEHARAKIVDERVLDVLVKLAGAESRKGRHVHAGVIHTYGYLFSTLKTPFGYKRARWVRDDIESGFRLPRGELGPRPTHGTLLANATYLFGSIAFRDDPVEAKTVRSLRPLVAPSVGRLGTQDLGAIRLTEALELKGRGKAKRKVVLRTDLVPFSERQTGSPNTHLLIYSFRDSSLPTARLVTAFPVADDFVEKLTDPSGMGDGKPITTRYNAYIQGVTDSAAPVTGKRRLWQAQRKQ